MAIVDLILCGAGFSLACSSLLMARWASEMMKEEKEIRVEVDQLILDAGKAVAELEDLHKAIEEDLTEIRYRQATEEWRKDC